MGQPKGIEPRVNDVLCGRGGYINSHPGNERFRQLVEKRKRVYLSARFKQEKRLVANSIVSDIRDNKGRFLAKNTSTGEWHDIGDEKSRDKTSQALRENAPTIRADIIEGSNKLRTGKSAKSGGKRKATSDAPKKVPSNSKKRPKDACMGSLEPEYSREPPRYYQHGYPPPQWYGPYYQYPQPAYGFSEEMYTVHSSDERGRSHQSLSPITAPDSLHRDHGSRHPPTEYAHSSKEATFQVSYPKEPLRCSEYYNASISADERTLWKSRTPLQAEVPPLETRQSYDQSDHSQSGSLDYYTNLNNPNSQHNCTRDNQTWEHSVSDNTSNANHSSLLLMQAANQIMGWDGSPRLNEDPIEDEIGQEVELVEMDCSSEEGHSASHNDQVMVPPPARPRPRRIDADWSFILGCQSSWLPDSFASHSSADKISSHEGFGMVKSAKERGEISGGNSFCSAFSQDQNIDGRAAAVQVSVSNSSRSYTSSTQQDLSKIDTYLDWTISNNGRCKSPSSMEQSHGSRNSRFECHLSPIATPKNSLYTSILNSRSSSCPKVARY
mmetsp:Transcript_27702/g.40891  ORF Transcript_27702/g.40891 Transcript_27702/m.40891 type:complete len:552 (-) Transcript_27702:181-1836(-)